MKVLEQQGAEMPAQRCALHFSTAFAGECLQHAPAALQALRRLLLRRVTWLFAHKADREIVLLAARTGALARSWFNLGALFFG